MKYGAMNFPIKPIADELADISALGFDYLELSMDPPQAHYSTIRQQMNSILGALASESMSIICHLPTFVSTADLTDSIREASLREMFNSLEVAAELGSQKVVLHPGHIGGLGIYVEQTALAHANKTRAGGAFWNSSKNSAPASVICMSAIILASAMIIFRWAPAKSIF